ncbi:MAG TPA: transglutaminase domain-containing protein [Gemmatimonadaceae bacterium]
MIKPRAIVGGAVLVAWLVGLAFLVRREYFRPRIERLAEAATRVTPGAVYYGVMQGDRQVGFASSTVDTTEASITVTDYLVADIPLSGKARRTTARTHVTLSRALRVKRFDLTLDSEGAPIRAGGRMDGDSVLVFALAAGDEKPDSQRIALTGPVLLPTLVPLAVALSETPRVGKHYVLPVLDPASMNAKDVALDVRAESTFVVNDSAVFDTTTKTWRGIQPASIRAWQVTARENATVFSGWVDEQGRIVETTQLGFVLLRLPYEVAFENWRNDPKRLVVTDDRDIFETTAIAANRRMSGRTDALKLRLTGVGLSEFDIHGQQQRLTGDTLIIRRASDSAMIAPNKLPYRYRDRRNSSPEPLIQAYDPQILRLANRIRGTERDARIVAERINQWVHDSIAPRITFGVPSAMEVLRTRTGDCNEHTQLFVALARAVGLPARIAAGLAYLDGKFYYHAWPEILLKDWVAVDPTFGQFPADAAHLRFTVGGLARQTELLRLMGNLKIEVLATNRDVR